MFNIPKYVKFVHLELEIFETAEYNMVILSKLVAALKNNLQIDSLNLNTEISLQNYFKNHLMLAEYLKKLSSYLEKNVACRLTLWDLKSQHDINTSSVIGFILQTFDRCQTLHISVILNSNMQLPSQDISTWLRKNKLLKIDVSTLTRDSIIMFLNEIKEVNIFV